MSRKHLLDTSLAHKYLLGTDNYKRCWGSFFKNDSLFSSNYIIMEFRRTYLNSLTKFYFTFCLPTFETIADTINFWSNRWKQRELKAILILMSQMLETHNLEKTEPKDKEKAVRQLGIYIRRIDILLRSQFKDVSKDSTRCARGAVNFKVKLENQSEDLRTFFNEFNDLDQCRSECRIDNFLLKKYIEEISSYIKYAQSIRENNENRGFKKIALNLEKISDEGESLFL